jgi:hypothetical protein
MPTQKILVDAVEAAEMLGLSERGFYKLLKRTPDLAAAARVVLSARATRSGSAPSMARWHRRSRRPVILGGNGVRTARGVPENAHW